MLPHGRTPLHIFPSSDALARWWADSRLIALAVPGVDGAHRALELVFVQRPKLRPLSGKFRLRVKTWQERTGGEDLMEGRVQRIGFWHEWLAKRGFFVGDVITRAQARELQREVAMVGRPYVVPSARPNQQWWRRPDEISKRHRALVFTGLTRGVHVDIIPTRTPTAYKREKLRADMARRRQDLERSAKAQEATKKKRRAATKRAGVVGTRERMRIAKKKGAPIVRQTAGEYSWVSVHL